MKKIAATTIISLLMATGIMAQTKEQMGGIYYAYHPDEMSSMTPAPKGFDAVYVCYVGRGGSGWLPSDAIYERVNKNFQDDANLTALGKTVKNELQQVWNNAHGNGGKLSAVGESQIQGIASRMASRYSSVFSKKNHIKARSSILPVSKKSMETMTTELLKQQGSLQIDMLADQSDMDWIDYTSDEMRQLIKSTQPAYTTTPDRFIATLFNDPSKISNKRQLMTDMFDIASDMQDVNTKQEFYSLFTPQEMRDIYKATNASMSKCNGLNKYNNKDNLRCCARLWQNIKENADAAVTSGDKSATLLFSSPETIYRLVSLLQINVPGLSADGMTDQMDLVLPAAANLQMVFYSDGTNTLVKFLYNEQECTVPVASVLEPYYKWSDIKTSVDYTIAHLM